MIIFNLLTMIALAIWTPTPWWIIVLMVFCWTIFDFQVPSTTWGVLLRKGYFKVWRKK